MQHSSKKYIKYCNLILLMFLLFESMWYFWRMSEAIRDYVDPFKNRRSVSMTSFLGIPMKEVLQYDDELSPKIINGIGSEPNPSEGESELSDSRQYDPQSWRSFAVCAGRTALFFPKDTERPQQRERREAQAKSLCSSCSAIHDCRSYARENREYGIWGGETEKDRDTLQNS